MDVIFESLLSRLVYTMKGSTKFFCAFFCLSLSFQWNICHSFTGFCWCFLKVKQSILFVGQKDKLKNKMESKMENPTQTYVKNLDSAHIRITNWKCNVMRWSSWEKKECIFCNIYLVWRNFFVICVFLKYNVLNIL